MSFERGGRADKYGNRYEDRYLAKLLLRLVREEFASITVEPLGINKDSVEYVAEQKDGTFNHYQCKGTNGNFPSWRFCDLKKHNVFSRAKEIIEAGGKNAYYFISPLQYNQLDELCKRARTNSSAQDFIDYQLTNSDVRNNFNNCMNEFGLERDNPADQERCISILSHCYFEQYILNLETQWDLEAYIGILFLGKPSTIRTLLERYAADKECYGVKITANDLVTYLKTKGIFLRSFDGDGNTLEKIISLNDAYKASFQPICETFVHRTTTDRILASLKNGYSAVLHGKAGTGKSGCLAETIHYLEQSVTLYLAIKLDKHLPHVSADAYGKQIELRESPVYCLSALAAGKPCVLIMDQLDALRWTSNHSSDALDVCKELIRQASTLNQHENAKISIVFASRTFDLENDNGLKELFEPLRSSSELSWEKINVDKFDSSDVIQLIGSRYNQLPSRLQKLLLTPSSLYVWTKLDENAQSNSISSVFELMDTWWKQISHNYTNAGFSARELSFCKNKIINLMENRAIFSLPRLPFADQANEIDFLISSGLLTGNSGSTAVAKSFSFTHQSFLDYFLITEMSDKLYSGCALKNLIGDRNDQTPLIRYRLMTILQNLVETNISLFVEQSIKLLESSSVRIYFKCTVFEIIGQCEKPPSEIYEIIDRYSRDPEWSDFITQVVFYGHPQFIRKMFSVESSEFPSDAFLSLLGSISDKDPDFVIDKLQPFALSDSKQDYKILWSLCHDVNHDSERMFHFRVQLLQNDPDLFENFWGFGELINKLSQRAIKLFEVIIESWQNHKAQNVHIGSPNHLNMYAKHYAWEIIDGLFEKICIETNDYLPQWQHTHRRNDYEVWNANPYHELTIRSVVEIVKTAFAECALSTPARLIAFLKDIEYPMSAVGHECIMHALLNLPLNYADKALKWFLKDINQKIFVFTSNPNNYLFYSEQIIKKFSPVCDRSLFKQLEEYICCWKECPDQMVYEYQQRLKCRKQFHEPVYYAYWGHFQKALLPYMDQARLSPYAQQLLGVVNRNPWIRLPYFYNGFHISGFKSIVSPVDKATDRLSDKTWLQIISTPAEKMKDKWSRSENDSHYVEANHQAFSSSLGEQAKREPLRFAKLSLSFPDQCYDGYILNVLYALENMKLTGQLDVKLISDVILRYQHSENPSIVIAIARIIEKHAKQPWSDDVVRIIERIALHHPNPTEKEYGVTGEIDIEQLSVESLVNTSLNCVRGCALHAIGALLWKHNDLGERFKDTILAESKDPNYAVRFSVMNSLLFYYDFDRSFAVNIFNSMIGSDLRMIASPGSCQILYREYDCHGAYYRGLLIQACSSKVDDLAERAAGLLCAITIFFDDSDALHFIVSHAFNDKQQGQICMQAVSSFNTAEYHEKSLHILKHLLDHSSKTLQGIAQLFVDERIEIQRDEAFLIYLMDSPQCEHLLHWFLNYLEKREESICGFARVLHSLSKRFPQIFSNPANRIMVNDLVKCVVLLFDRGKDDPSIREICLNIWDNLFMSNLHAFKPLSDMIDKSE